MNAVFLKELIEQTRSQKVLFLEDNKDSREQTLKLLQNFFNDITVAKDGAEGLEYIYSSTYDLIFSDINMPRLDGITLAKKVKAYDPATAVIMITAYDNSEYLLDCLNSGINGYIIKPFSLEQLADQIQRNLHAGRNHDDNLIRLSEDYSWDTQRSILFKNREMVHLSANEIRLLEYLISSKGRICSVEEIDFEIYSEMDFSAKRIRNLISRFRIKTGNELIESVYGQGYRLRFSPS